MNGLRVWWLRLAGLFDNQQRDRELAAELESHLQMHIEDNLRSGMTSEQARRDALIKLGGIEQTKESVRDRRGFPLLDDLLQDLRFGLRMLRKSPGFTAVAVLTLALGIGASTVAFSAFFNLLFAPFAARDADRLVVLCLQNGEIAALPELNLFPLGGPLSDIETIRSQNQVFEDIVGYHRAISLLRDGNEIYQLYMARVTPNAFDFYGVPPLLGRGIVPADGRAEAPRVFVMSYKTWKSEFNADPRIIGKSFVVDDEPRTLVGIMPSRFQAYGALQQIWVPITSFPVATGSAHERAVDTMMARLKTGANLETASAELDVIVKRLAKDRPDDFPKHFAARALSAVDFLMGPYGIGSAGGPETEHFDLKHTLYGLMAGAMILLLIACSNVANLLLARAAVREKEIAVRAALGATRGRLVQQLFVESFVLAMGACMLGCLIAYFGMKGVTALIPHKGASIGGEAVIQIDPYILFFTLAVTIFTTVLCGLTSALHAVRRDLQPSLAGSDKSSDVSFRHGKLRAGLVVGEVALSILLLTGAGLMMRSFFLLTHIDLGFNLDNILFVAFGNPYDGVVPAEKREILFQKIVQRLRELPGVAEVAINNSLPGYNPGGRYEVTVQGSAHAEEVGLDGCSENLFQTLELQLQRGSWLSESDVVSARHVAVINQTMALHFFGAEDPVGQQIKAKAFIEKGQPPQDVYFQVVGVLRDVKDFGPQVPVIPMAFIPYTIQGGGLLLIKTKVDPASLMHAVQERVWSFDRDEIFAPGFGPYKATFYRLTYSAHEFGLMTFAPLAGIGLFLVVTGVFSVTAYNVSQQIHEIGVRMALGAQQGDILKMFLLRGVRLVTAGVILGLFASYALTRFLASQIWGVSPTDSWTFVSVVALVSVVGISASILSARRATHVDPMEALRYE